METAVEFGRKIRLTREALGLTIRELGNLTDISSGYLAPVERGDFGPPSEKKIVRIARALAIDQDELVLLAGKMPTRFREAFCRNPAAAARMFRRFVGDG